VTLAFAFHGAVLDEAIEERGAMPLPPYIASRRAPDEQDRADYQTMFADAEDRWRRRPPVCISPMRWSIASRRAASRSTL